MLKPSVRWLLTGLAALVAMGFGSGGTAATPRPEAATHTVVIEAMRFDPQELKVRVGDTIVWTNHDPFPHTASAVGRQFDSREIAPGRSWKYTATKAGVFAYACALHSTMLGTLRVE